VPSTDQKSSPPLEPAHPICPNCDVPMWMTKVEHFGSPISRGSIAFTSASFAGASVSRHHCTLIEIEVR
jgi:hypothetical protein